MKKIGFAILAFLAIVAGALFIVAQTRSQGDDRRRFAFGGMGKGQRRAFSKLGLSEEQRSQADAVMATSREKVEPLKEALKMNREKLRAATENGAFDESAISAIANEQGRLQAEMIIEHARSRSQVFALLNEEQKAKFKEMDLRRGNGFGDWPRKRGDRAGGPWGNLSDVTEPDTNPAPAN